MLILWAKLRALVLKIFSKYLVVVILVVALSVTNCYKMVGYQAGFFFGSW